MALSQYLSSGGVHSTRARLLLATLAILSTLLVFNELFPSPPTSTLSSFLPLSRSLQAAPPTPDQAPFDAPRPQETVRTVAASGSSKKTHVEWRLSDEHAWLAAKPRERVMFVTSASHNYGQLDLAG